MGKGPETLFQEQVLKYLKETIGGYWIKIHVSSFTSRGVPDVIGSYKGRFIAFELKRPDGKGTVSKLQEYNIKLINEAGGYACVIQSMEQLKELFEDDKILRLQ